MLVPAEFEMSSKELKLFLSFRLNKEIMVYTAII